MAICTLMKTIDPLAELRRAVAAAGTNRQWALAHGLSRAYVGEVLNGKKEPGPVILEALGLEKVVIYRRIDRAQAA